MLLFDRYIHNTLYTALFATAANAFVPSSQQQRQALSLHVTTTIRDEVDSIGNNVAVKELLVQIESSGLLTKVAESGLLSKAQDSGLSLTKLEPLLALAAENEDVLIIAEAATPEILPLLPTVIGLAPPALPLLAQAIAIPPAALSAVGFASLAAAAAAIIIIPDTSLLNVAGQTFAAGALGGLGIASIGGGVVLGKILD